MRVEKYQLMASENFALLRGPYDKKQHQNEQRGLDLYVAVINLNTGETCQKKLYENKRGLHFKHTGLGSTYLDEMTRPVFWVPWQVISVE